MVPVNPALSSTARTCASRSSLAITNEAVDNVMKAKANEELLIRCRSDRGVMTSPSDGLLNLGTPCEQLAQRGSGRSFNLLMGLELLGAPPALPVGAPMNIDDRQTVEGRSRQLRHKPTCLRCLTLRIRKLSDRQ